MPRVHLAVVVLVAAVACAAGYFGAQLTGLAPLATVPGQPVKASAAALEVPAVPRPELLEMLRKGGYVVYFRHASRTETRTMAPFDTAPLREPAFTFAEAPPGTCLNEEGKAEARLLGHAVKALGVPVGKVLASPTCRTRQSAEFAFGRVDVAPFLGYRAMFAESERKAAGRELVRLINTPPAGGMNTFLFAHANNLEHVGLGVTLDQAEAAVFAPQAGAEAPKLVAKMPLLDWVHLLPPAKGAH